MANSIETFYSGNLATLARDLGAPSVVSFTVNRLPLVDGGGNVVGWEYSGTASLT